MNKWVMISLVAILMVGTIFNGVLYFQQSGDLDDAFAEISSLEGDVLNLQLGNTSLQQDVNLLEDANATLAGTIAGLNDDITAIEEVSGLPVPNIVSAVEPSVVLIYVAGYGFSASGSGIIVTNDGYVVTNHHVIDDATTIEITTMDGEVYSATVIGTNSGRDLALLKITSTKTDFTPIAMGTAEDIIVGESVIAIGYPLGPYLMPGAATFTQGIISAMRALDGYDYVQTDASITHGNSGGALVNNEGKLIGINSSGYGDGLGLNFAIPIDEILVFIGIYITL